MNDFKLMQNSVASFDDTQLLGQYRTFGEYGPTYHILEPSRQRDDGEWLLRIEVPATGEVMDYPYSKARHDPAA